MDTTGLAYVMELRGVKLRTCIYWNYFQISPAKFVYFSKYILKHIQLIHQFFCVNSIHTIKIGILEHEWKIKIYLEKVVLLVKLLGAVAGILSIEPHLKGGFGFNCIFGYSLFIHWRYLTWCAERVCIYPKFDILPKNLQYLQPSIIY